MTFGLYRMRKESGKERIVLVLQEGPKRVLERISLEPVGVREIIKVVSFYLLFVMGAALSFLSFDISSAEKTLLSQRSSSNERVKSEKKGFLGSEQTFFTLEEIKKILSASEPSSSALGRALFSVEELLKRCMPDDCRDREKLLMLKGAAEIRVEERFKNLRFEAEKSLRLRDFSQAEKSLREILSLVREKTDPRYRYALDRLGYLRRLKK